MDLVFKKDNRKIVPWFSMLEWREVYTQIYSNDIVAQRNGYEQMLVWKARCPTLPAGVECTLSLLHVHLQDQDMWPQIVDGRLPRYREHDLRLMYSTSIMRFLNHISTVAQDQFETMYQMAKRVQIPDWMVSIRHDLAHGYNLPSLNILRAATNFTLGWIHEHYWKGEAKLTVDYFATEDTKNGDRRVKTYLQDYIEVWQALKLYHLHGYKYIKDIPDSQLLSRINEVIDRLPKKSKKKLAPMGSSDVDTLCENSAMSKQMIDDREVNPVLEQLFKHLEIFMGKNKTILAKDELLVTTVLECETFLPDEDLLRSLMLDNDDINDEALPSRLRELWQKIFILLQDADLLSTLMKKLVENVNKNEENTQRRKVAALWLKEICLGLTKTKVTIASTTKIQDKNKISDIEMKKSFMKKGVPTSIKNQIVERIEKTHPELKDVLFLKTGYVPESKKILKLVLLSPNKWTVIFLPSLLDLMEPELQSTMKKNVLDLVQTYICSDVEPVQTEAQPPEVEMYTLEMLTNNSKEDHVLEASEMEVDKPQIIDQVSTVTCPAEPQSFAWIRSETYLEWENCPLGILPWQKSETMGKSNLTCNTVWRPTLLADNGRIDSVFPVNFQDTINSHEVPSIRKRKKKNKKHANLLKKACKIIDGGMMRV